ncbi:MAG TPA: aminotransferase class I/II-fold pyridoxal phosphate-dependent enzyme, partial [Myxococcaceae bacterium]|nr:aminotransferase class I/II-fold pyridoxal phosphate-dependent enzyme [Myxococcaceae bacterium]
MHLTRRTFLEALGTGTAAATALQLPFAGSTRAATPAVSAGGSAAPPILLNSNENAYGPSARVSAAIRDAVGAANRYPDAARREFIERVAARHRVSEKQVLVGCGSVEILRVAVQAFTGPGKKLIMASPTFEVIGHFAEA